MESSDEDDVACVLAAWYLKRRQNQNNRRRRNRRWYVRPINLCRDAAGEFTTLVNEMRTFDHEYYYQYFRMSPAVFSNLLDRVRPLIEHSPTHAIPISAEQRLTLTLRVLAGGSLSYAHKSFRMGYDSARKIVHETTEAIWQALKKSYLVMPTKEKWLQIAEEFWTDWNMPCCLGAIDGKHVVIQKPQRAGSQFYNYKRDHSIVLMAVVDAKYRFVYVDIGAYGRESDGGVFSRCEFGKALKHPANPLDIPGLRLLPNSDVMCPHFLVADDAFPLGKHIQKPFGGAGLPLQERIFDYRLSRARRTVENAFGIMASRFRILRRPIAFNPENAERVVKACVVLHNFLRSENEQLYMAPGMMDVEGEDGVVQEGAWRSECVEDPTLAALQHPSRGASEYGTAVRVRLRDYFLSPAGSLPWQECIANRGMLS